ncbi:cytochrome c oxidase assembly protein [Kribbella sp. DT2]|uniref:cytochrome c oxidase assembly protein n=1 Tax=Kribbella sp. DT2 TaxID=3393427 RepID=UPI003CF2F810
MLGAIVCAGAMVARRLTTVGLLAVVSVMSPWPLALTGHAAGAVNHDMAVNAQAVHLIGISAWTGGLAGLFLVRHRLGGSAAAVVARFSTLATVGFVLVALSGTLAAVLRLGTPSALLSTYGMLLVIKVAALSLLGFAGWYQRRRIRRIQSAVVDRAREIRWLVLCELVVMTAAIGIGVALGRTPPPGEERRLTTAESLLGYAMPPKLGGAEWFTQWRVDTLWTPLAIIGAACYLWGVVRLRRRGDRWPTGRLIAWLAGTVLLIWATSGAPGVYGDVLFSMHMVQHMTIATAVPTLLVLGAPVTLALRTARPRRDGSRGWREWLLVTVKSRPLAVLGHPLVAAGLFVVGLVAFYYTPLFELSLRTHTGHQLMLLHFLLSGYLFASVICGSDPGAARPAYPLRVLLLMVTFGFHAFFSISLMSSGVVLAGDWYGSLGRPWGDSLERDQYVGASLGWALGDYPLALMAIGMVIGWVRSDQREARRFDRRADRDGDKSLSDYNDYLGRLGRRESADAETREKLS